MKTDISEVIIWDAVMLVVDALRHAGPDATAEQVRSYILAQKNWTGIAGSYDFTDPTLAQRGVGARSSVIYRWNPESGTFAIVSAAAGYLR
jgi:hypothetical protein